MPRTSHTTFSIQEFVNKIKGGDHIAPHDKISIKASTIFNRGDESEGVWSKKMKQDYIDSIMNGYPIGQISLVKDYGNHSSPWLIIDALNRARTLRDLLSNKFTVPHNLERGVLFGDLPISIQEEFKNKRLVRTTLGA